MQYSVAAFSRWCFELTYLFQSRLSDRLPSVRLLPAVRVVVFVSSSTPIARARSGSWSSLSRTSRIYDGDLASSSAAASSLSFSRKAAILASSAVSLSFRASSRW